MSKPKYCLHWRGDRFCGSLITNWRDASCSWHKEQNRLSYYSDRRNAPDGHRAWTKQEQWYEQAYSNLLAVVRKNELWDRWHEANADGTWYEEFLA